MLLSKNFLMTILTYFLKWKHFLIVFFNFYYHIILILATLWLFDYFWCSQIHWHPLDKLNTSKFQPYFLSHIISKCWLHTFIFFFNITFLIILFIMYYILKYRCIGATIYILFIDLFTCYINIHFLLHSEVYIILVGNIICENWSQF